MNISKKFLIVLIVLVFTGGAGTAYAGIVLPTITLGGNVDVTGNLDVNGPITSPTISDIQHDISQISSIYRVSVSNHDSNYAIANCDPGDTLLGGGGGRTNVLFSEHLIESKPFGINGWRVYTSIPTAEAFAICSDTADPVH